MRNKIPLVIALLLLSHLFHISLLHGKANPGKSIDFAIPYYYDGNLDPVEKNYINLQVLFRSVYTTLFKLDAQLKPYAFLVESYTQKGKTISFRLRARAKFSDGSEITATDVIASIEAGMKHNIFPNPVYHVIEGGEAYYKGTTTYCHGLKSTGLKTFEMVLKSENIEFTHYFAVLIMPILPAHRNNKPDSPILFSGAFQVEKIEKKKRKTVVTLKKNPFYLGNAPKLKTLVFHFYERTIDCERAIERGLPDLFIYNFQHRYPQSTYKYHYFKTPIYGTFYLKLNAAKGPLKDKRLRTFLKHFLRAQNYTRSRYWPLTIPTNLVLPHGLTGYSVFKPLLQEDFRKYIPKKPVTLKCINDRSGIRETLFTQLKKRLMRYNINLQLQWESNMPSIHLHEENQDIDITSLYYLVDIPLSSYFYESLFIPGHELNVFRYEVPEALALLNKYRKERDGLKKLKILSQLETIAQDEVIVIPLLTPLSLLGYKQHLKNVSIDKFLKYSP